MNENKRRTWLVVLATLLVILIGCGGGIAWLTSTIGKMESITDSAKYAQLHARFPSRMRSVIPASIPAGSTVVSFEYNSASGLGPSSQSLVCRIRMQPAQAAEYFEERRRHLEAMSGATHRRSGKNELEFQESGDQYARISIDRDTGEIELRMGDN